MKFLFFLILFLFSPFLALGEQRQSDKIAAKTPVVGNEVDSRPTDNLDYISSTTNDAATGDLVSFGTKPPGTYLLTGASEVTRLQNTNSNIQVYIHHLGTSAGVLFKEFGSNPSAIQALTPSASRVFVITAPTEIKVSCNVRLAHCLRKPGGVRGWWDLIKLN